MNELSPSRGATAPCPGRTAIAAAAALLMVGSLMLMAAPAAADNHHPQIVDAWSNYWEGTSDGLYVRWSTQIAGNAVGGPGGYTIHEADDADCSGTVLATGTQTFWLPERPNIRDLPVDNPDVLVEGQEYRVRVASGTERYVSEGQFVYNEEECFLFTYEVRSGFGGQLTDAESGDPIPGATVRVFDSSGTQVDEVTTVTTSPDAAQLGHYRIEGLPAGTYTVTASDEGYQSQTQSVTIEPGFLEGVDFALQQGEDPQTGAVAGTVTSTGTNAPIAGATVTAGGQSTTTGADGSYTISDLAPGEHTVTASAPGHQQGSQTATVVAGQTTTVDFGLQQTQQQTGTVTGRVTNQAGQGVAGATVTVGGRTATTDAQGNYTVTNVAPGQHTLTVSAAGYQQASQQVTVTAGQTTTANVTLQADDPGDPDGDPRTKDDCKNGGWEDYGFRNQGQCIRFVNTGQDSRP